VANILAGINKTKSTKPCHHTFLIAHSGIPTKPDAFVT
jgi:hypothetical protein